LGTTYHYANLTKREWFSAGALGENDKLSGLGVTLASRAFHLLLIREGEPSKIEEPVRLGRWAGDAVLLVGDDDEEWDRYRDELVAIDADVILLLHEHNGFERIGEAAARNDVLFMQLCHLVATAKVPRLEAEMRGKFGSGFLRRYKELYKTINWFVPKELGRPGKA
jgi:hypothetical protein